MTEKRKDITENEKRSKDSKNKSGKKEKVKEVIFTRERSQPYRRMRTYKYKMHVHCLEVKNRGKRMIRDAVSSYFFRSGLISSR